MSTRTNTNTNSYFGSSGSFSGSFGSSIIPQSQIVDHIRSAILAGNLSEVERLCSKISQNDVSSYRDVYGNTILHTAILLGRPEIAQYLINFGCPLTTANARGETCYDLLAKSNIGSLVKYVHDSEKKKVETSQMETRSKATKIQTLETEVRSLENANVRLSKDNQDLTIELGKRKRDIEELETQKSNLIKASKKK
jgi:ankyrin repeat protein